MRMSLKVSIGLYCLVGALLMSGGLRYVLASEYMPYHEEATRIPWGDLSAAFQGTFLGFMKVQGAGSFSMGLTVVLLTLLGLRQGVTWSFWALPLVAITYLGLAAYSTFVMNATTAGGPPLAVGLTVGALTIAAAVLSYIGRDSVQADDLDRDVEE